MGLVGSPLPDPTREKLRYYIIFIINVFLLCKAVCFFTAQLGYYTTQCIWCTVRKLSVLLVPFARQRVEKGGVPGSLRVGSGNLRTVWLAIMLAPRRSFLRFRTGRYVLFYCRFLLSSLVLPYFNVDLTIWPRGYWKVSFYSLSSTKDYLRSADRNTTKTFDKRCSRVSGSFWVRVIGLGLGVGLDLRPYLEPTGAS